MSLLVPPSQLSKPPGLIKPVATPLGFVSHGVAPFSDPTAVPGLIGWWDLSDASTRWQDSVGGTQADADGDPIGVLEDKSGAGNDLSQGTSANKPVVRTSQFNGLDAAEFDGADDVLSRSPLAPSGDADAEWSMWVVAKPVDNGSANRVLANEIATGGTFLGLINFNFSNGNLTIAAVNGGTNNVNYSAPTTLSIVGQNIKENGENRGILNDQRDSVSAGAFSSNADNNFTLGAGRQIDNWFEGHACEAVAYQHYLTTTEEDRLVAYFNDKWAVY